MTVRCPHCGSRETGEAVRAARNGPAYECRGCGRQFGYPPVYRNGRKEKGAETVLLPDILTGVTFSVGGYPGGTDYVNIVRNGASGAVCFYHMPAARKDPVFGLRRVSAAEWERVKEKLFYQLFVHEWKQEYYNHEIPGGTQWELTLLLEDGRICPVFGSNEYPPLFLSLEKMFHDYFTEEIPPVTDSEEEAFYVHLFRHLPAVVSVIRNACRKAGWAWMIGRTGG